MKEIRTVWNPFRGAPDFLLAGTRRRHLRRIAVWRKTVIERLVKDVFAPDLPYYYDTAFSFVQPEKFDTDSPIRFSLFYPDYPVAIDVLGPESYSDYRQACWYLSKSDWDRDQKHLALKRNRLLEYKCPYLMVWDYEATSIPSLSESVRNILGFYPK